MLYYLNHPTSPSTHIFKNIDALGDKKKKIKEFVKVIVEDTGCDRSAACVSPRSLLKS
jgi:hypothetical protein